MGRQSAGSKRHEGLLATKMKSSFCFMGSWKGKTHKLSPKFILKARYPNFDPVNWEWKQSVSMETLIERGSMIVS